MAKTDQKPKTEEKLTLRLPVEVHDALVISASKNERSLNSEMVFRLRRSVEADS